MCYSNLKIYERVGRFMKFCNKFRLCNSKKEHMLIKKRLFLSLSILLLFFCQKSNVLATEEKINTVPTMSTDDIIIETSVKVNDTDIGEDSIHLMNGGVLKCSFSIENIGVSEKNLSVIFATYTVDNRLSYIESLVFTINPESTETKEFEYVFDIAKESKGKIMFWDAVSTLIPVKGTVFFDNDGVTSYFYDSDNRLIQANKADGTSIIFSYDSMGNLLERTKRK